MSEDWDTPVTVTLPLYLPSVANLREHFRKRAKRAAEHRAIARMILSSSLDGTPPLPVQITLTRCGPRKLDSDNLASSFKAVRDGVADWLVLDDGDERIEWDYEQERAERYQAQVTIKRINT